MTPIYEYLQKGSVPDDDLEANRLSRNAKMYTLVEGVLYKRGTQGVLMRCIPQSEGLTSFTTYMGASVELMLPQTPPCML